jgi:hypothetical protein
MKTCAAIMTPRRSKLSAKAPASRAKITMGSVVEDCTSVTISADSAIDSINHEAPTTWIRPPNCETRFAIQTLRNIPYRNGDSAEPAAGARDFTSVRRPERAPSPPSDSLPNEPAPNITIAAARHETRGAYRWVDSAYRLDRPGTNVHSPVPAAVRRAGHGAPSS